MTDRRKLPDGYSIRELPRSGKVAAYNGPGAQLVRPTQDSVDAAIALAWADFEGIPLEPTEPANPKTPPADKGTPAVVTTPDPPDADDDDLSAEIDARRSELANMKAEELRKLATGYSIKYRNKTQAIESIIDAEYPVDDSD